MGNFDTDGKAIFMVFVGAIIALVLIFVIADQVNLTTTTIEEVNTTVTANAPNVTLDVRGRQLISSINIFNTTNISQNLGERFGASLQTGISTTSGLLSVQLVFNDTGVNFEGEEVNVSYTANPDGYISDSGGRSVTKLILIFAALAILIFTVVVFIQFGFLGELLRRK